MGLQPPVTSGLAGLLSVVLAGEPGLPQGALAIELARAQSALGRSVLLIDCGQNPLADILGITLKSTLSQVIETGAALSSAIHITPCANYALCCAGQTDLGALLGLIAAQTLNYDCVIVAAPPGCTPAHIRLTCAADNSIMLFDSRSDRFMRAFWMLDAIRERAPRCDPFMVGVGDGAAVQEAYDLLAHTVRDYLGAPPPLALAVPDTELAPQCGHVLIRLMQGEDNYIGGEPQAMEAAVQ